jgi:hypothetical protein
MDFNHRTDSAKDSPTKEPDTALPVVIIIYTMIPFECLKSFSKSRFHSDIVCNYCRLGQQSLLS